MWEWFTNRGLRTFCHLRHERSFDFGHELHSLLCHRCSGIYSGFLIFFLLGWVLRYRGYWRPNLRPLHSLVLGAGLLSLSVFQVWIQKATTNPFLTGGTARFAIGALTGLGLLHLYYGMLEEPKEKKVKPLMFFYFLVTLGLHGTLSHLSMLWVSGTSLLGLVFVYGLMNHLVIESMFPRLKMSYKVGLVPLFVALEWSLLFWNNVLRQQHG